MRRRTLLATTLAAAVAPAAVGAKPPAVTVIYVGGWDCPPCLRWKNDSKPEWVASALYRRVRYVEIESPRLREAYQDRYWPDEFKPVRDALPRKSGTPRYLVVKDGALLANEFGPSNWPKALEAIRAALGQAAG